MPLYRVETIGDVTVVHVGGSAGEPLGADVGLEGLIDRGVRKLLLDTGAMDVVRSWFLGQLVELHRRARAGECLFRVCCPEPDLRDVFRITKLDQIIPTAPSLGEALAGFAGGPTG